MPNRGIFEVVKLKKHFFRAIILEPCSGKQTKHNYKQLKQNFNSLLLITFLFSLIKTRITFLAKDIKISKIKIVLCLLPRISCHIREPVINSRYD